LQTIILTQAAGTRGLDFDKAVYFGEKVMLIAHGLEIPGGVEAWPVLSVYDYNHLLLARSDALTQTEHGDWRGGLDLNTELLPLLFAFQKSGFEINLFAELHPSGSVDIIGKGMITVCNNSKAARKALGDEDEDGETGGEPDPAPDFGVEMDGDTLAIRNPDEWPDGRQVMGRVETGEAPLIDLRFQIVGYHGLAPNAMVTFFAWKVDGLFYIAFVFREDLP